MLLFKIVFHHFFKRWIFEVSVFQCFSSKGPRAFPPIFEILRVQQCIARESQQPEMVVIFVRLIQKSPAIFWMEMGIIQATTCFLNLCLTETFLFRWLLKSQNQVMPEDQDPLKCHWTTSLWFLNIVLVGKKLLDVNRSLSDLWEFIERTTSEGTSHLKEHPIWRNKPLKFNCLMSRAFPVDKWNEELISDWWSENKMFGDPTQVWLKVLSH